MGLVETIKSEAVVLTEGSVVERIRREFDIALDPHVANAAMVRDVEGRILLERIYRGYLDVAREYGYPMIILAPTWRANADRITRAGHGDAEELNRECVELVSSIRDDYADISENIFVGGLLACKNDAYRAEEALSEFPLRVALPFAVEPGGVRSVAGGCDALYEIAAAKEHLR